MTGGITAVPANEANWEDLWAVFSTRGDPYQSLLPAVQELGQGVALGLGSRR